jgi:hypothetical protein
MCLVTITIAESHAQTADCAGGGAGGRLAMSCFSRRSPDVPLRGDEPLVMGRGGPVSLVNDVLLRRLLPPAPMRDCRPAWPGKTEEAESTKTRQEAKMARRTPAMPKATPAAARACEQVHAMVQGWVAAPQEPCCIPRACVKGCMEELHAVRQPCSVT